METENIETEPKFRNLCFTINNYTQTDINRLNKLWKNDKVKYLVYGLEIAKSGTEHIQGYAELVKQTRFKAVKKLFGEQTHIEKRFGTAKQAAQYCKKDGNFYEIGNISQPGKRTDMEAIRDKIKKKTPIIEIVERYPGQYIRYHKGIEKLNNLYNNIPRTIKPKVIWIYGKSGTGKTKYIFEHHSDIYVKDETKWWDGYAQNEAILIDDFEGIWPFRNLLRLLDRYPYQGEYKGGYVHINSPYIYITSEFPPEHYYYDATNDNHFLQLHRRIDEEICLTSSTLRVSEVSG